MNTFEYTRYQKAIIDDIDKIIGAENSFIIFVEMPAKSGKTTIAKHFINKLSKIYHSSDITYITYNSSRAEEMSRYTALGENDCYGIDRIINVAKNSKVVIIDDINKDTWEARTGTLQEERYEKLKKIVNDCNKVIILGTRFGNGDVMDRIKLGYLNNLVYHVNPMKPRTVISGPNNTASDNKLSPPENSFSHFIQAVDLFMEELFMEEAMDIKPNIIESYVKIIDDKYLEVSTGEYQYIGLIPHYEEVCIDKKLNDVILRAMQGVEIRCGVGVEHLAKEAYDLLKARLIKGK